MPRQAIYVLASRTGRVEAKQALVTQYDGETKRQMLDKIRQQFPLDAEDKRQSDRGEQVVKALRGVLHLFEGFTGTFSQSKKKEMLALLKAIETVVKEQ